MPRVSRKQAELNREIIVEAATHLFRERGLHGISLSDVMAAAMGPSPQPQPYSSAAKKRATGLQPGLMMSAHEIGRAHV